MKLKSVDKINHLGPIISLVLSDDLEGVLGSWILESVKGIESNPFVWIKKIMEGVLLPVISYGIETWNLSSRKLSM